MTAGRGRAQLPVPRVVLFDMDDTIFDHALTCRDALARVRQDWPWLQQRPIGEVWKEYSRLLEAVHPEVVRGRLDPNTARRQRFRLLARFCGEEISDPEAAELSRQYRATYQALRRPVPGVGPLLERLHGRVTVVIVSNNETAEQEEKLAFLGFERWVDHLVVSEEVGVAKPDPRIFEAALTLASALPDDAVMVGDSWANDVVGARGARIGAVWFNRFEAPPPQALGVPEIRSFRSPRRAEETLFREAARPRLGPE